MALIGKLVFITDKASDYFGAWGIVKGFDGESYLVAIGDSRADYNWPVFGREQFRVPRGRKEIAV